MTDQIVDSPVRQRVIEVLREHFRAGSKSWLDYERAKTMLTTQPLNPRDYEETMNTISAWLGL